MLFYRDNIPHTRQFFVNVIMLVVPSTVGRLGRLTTKTTSKSFTIGCEMAHHFKGAEGGTLGTNHGKMSLSTYLIEGTMMVI